MPPAGLVWTLIILSLAVLFLVGRGSVGAKELDQSQFEEMLTRGDIISAKVASESENVLSVTGEYKLSPADAALVKQQNPNSNGNGQYKTKVLNSDSLQQLLREKVGKVEITLPDTWVTYMLSWLPMLIIAVLLWIFFARQFRNSNRSALQFGKSRAKMIAPNEINVTFDDVAGAAAGRVVIDRATRRSGGGSRRGGSCISAARVEAVGFAVTETVRASSSGCSTEKPVIEKSASRP